MDKKPISNSHWTKKEKEILKKYFPLEGIAVVSRLPGRSRPSVASCAYRVMGLKIAKSDSRPWTESELKTLSRYFPEEGKEVCARLPGRKRLDCYKKAKEIGLTAPIKKPWSDEETAIMKTFYKNVSMTELQEKLPGRGEYAIRKQASRMGLCTPPPEWTKDEEDILLKYYPTESRAVSQRLPGRSAAACRARYHKIAPASMRKPWTTKEDRVLLQAIQIGNDQALMEMLPGRTLAACKQRARHLAEKTQG